MERAGSVTVQARRDCIPDPRTFRSRSIRPIAERVSVERLCRYGHACVARLANGGTFRSRGSSPRLPRGATGTCVTARGARAGGKRLCPRCAQCHGKNGAGDGTASGQFPISPTNFRAQRPTIARSLRVLRDGIEGTPMAPWSRELPEAGRLSSESRWTVGGRLHGRDVGRSSLEGEPRSRLG